MRTLQVIKTRDGQIFEKYNEALAHCENKFGEELDGLLKTAPNIGHRAKMDIFRAVLQNPTGFREFVKWGFEYYELKESDVANDI